MATTVTTKGQVTIPVAIRDRLGIEPGDAVDFQLAQDGKVIIVKHAGETSPRSRFAAFVGSAGPGMTTDEIMALTRGDDEAA